MLAAVLAIFMLSLTYTPAQASLPATATAAQAQYPGTTWVTHGAVGNPQAFAITCQGWALGVPPFWLQQGQNSVQKCGGQGYLVWALDIGNNFDIACRPNSQPGGATLVIQGTYGWYYMPDGYWYCWTVGRGGP